MGGAARGHRVWQAGCARCSTGELHPPQRREHAGLRSSFNSCVPLQPGLHYLHALHSLCRAAQDRGGGACTHGHCHAAARVQLLSGHHAAVRLLQEAVHAKLHRCDGQHCARADLQVREAGARETVGSAWPCLPWPVQGRHRHPLSDEGRADYTLRHGTWVRRL